LRSLKIKKDGPRSSIHKQKLAYGRKIIGHSLDTHKSETQIISSIKKMYCDEGLGPVAIARILDAMKVPTKKQGKKWDHSVVIAILERERIYKITQKSPRIEGSKWKS
jgi:hypothetical protein